MLRVGYAFKRKRNFYKTTTPARDSLLFHIYNVWTNRCLDVLRYEIQLFLGISITMLSKPKVSRSEKPDSNLFWWISVNRLLMELQKYNLTTNFNFHGSCVVLEENIHCLVTKFAFNNKIVIRIKVTLKLNFHSWDLRLFGHVQSIVSERFAWRIRKFYIFIA